jgi:hypothetical protein
LFGCTICLSILFLLIQCESVKNDFEFCVEIINFILFKNTILFIMRNITSLLAYFIIGLCISVELNAADGDTIHVRTIEFQDRREGWYNFPDHRESFQRIMLHFTLRCPPGKQCGEWDYISNIFVNRFFAPSYQVDGKRLSNSVL